jgi:hypothetical protein
MKFTSLILLSIFSLHLQAQEIYKIFDFPTEISESSGLIYIPEGILPNQKDLYITINDSGNDPVVFFLSSKGNIIKKVWIKNGNVDWEALAVDKDFKNVFIGDFGNNSNKRKDLKVLKVPLKPMWVRDTIEASEILFSYPEQFSFPPAPDSLMFDTEAFFWQRSKLFIFTKNRKTEFDGQSLVYVIPDESGTYKATLLDTLIFPGFRYTHWVTDAAIERGRSRVAILGGANVFLFLDYTKNDFQTGRFVEVPLPITRQFEGIAWKAPDKLLLSCENSKLGGAALFELDIQNIIKQHDSIRRAEVKLENFMFNDTLQLSLNLEVAGQLYYELFNASGDRVAFGTGDFFPKGTHQVSIPITHKLFNGAHMINIIIGDRPHGFIARRFNPDDAAKGREELENYLKNNK